MSAARSSSKLPQTKKLSVSQLFWEQVAFNFIVVAVLIALGALLTFKVMGEEYSQWTVVGFFATVLRVYRLPPGRNAVRGSGGIRQGQG